MRAEAREQLDGAVSEADFEASLPPWDKLPPELQEAKVLVARDELLRVLDRAGYQVRRKRRSAPEKPASA